MKNYKKAKLATNTDLANVEQHSIEKYIYISINFQQFTMPAGITDTIIAWESKILSNEKANTSITASNSLSPKLRWLNSGCSALHGVNPN